MAPTSKSAATRRALRKAGKPVARPLARSGAGKRVTEGPPSRPTSKSKIKIKARDKVGSKARLKVKRKTVAKPYWETKALSDMTRAQWEQLCDGCGQCCMLKVEDEDTAQVFITRLACKLLDIGSCRCGSYPDRHDFVPDCVVLKPETVGTYAWLPRTCAYRLLAEGKPLAWWHPLVSGDPDTVHDAGISVRTWARSEKGVKPSAITRYIIEEV